MACCTRYCAGETQFDSKVAQRDLRRYRRRGADATTRLMLAEVRRWPLEGQQLLDVGGGIGVISAELAGTSIADVTVVEASPAYLEVARREVRTRYGSRPTQFILGDFAAIADSRCNVIQDRAIDFRVINQMHPVLPAGTSSASHRTFSSIS